MKPFYKFMQFHEAEEDKDLSLEKWYRCVLFLLHTRDTKNMKPHNIFHISLLFNVVVDAVIWHWVILVAGEEAVSEEFGQAVKWPA